MSKTLGELQYRVGIWRRHIRGISTDAERVGELAEKVSGLADNPRAADKMADVLIALLVQAEASGVPLLAATGARFTALQDQDQTRRPHIRRKAVNGN